MVRREAGKDGKAGKEATGTGTGRETERSGTAGTETAQRDLVVVDVDVEDVVPMDVDVDVGITCSETEDDISTQGMSDIGVDEKDRVQDGIARVVITLADVDAPYSFFSSSSHSIFTSNCFCSWVCISVSFFSSCFCSCSCSCFCCICLCSVYGDDDVDVISCDK